MYMLDTNVISHIIQQNPNVIAKLAGLSADEVCISSIAYAEILYGLAKKPQATSLRQKVEAVMSRIPVTEFTANESKFYGQFRVDMENSGKSLAEMDLLIAAHAHCIGAVLVTADKAFEQLPNLIVEDWTL